ncbi:hypothetical protein EJB05_53566, partial [Eragrostis curvula]
MEEITIEMLTVEVQDTGLDPEAMELGRAELDAQSSWKGERGGVVESWRDLKRRGGLLAPSRRRLTGTARLAGGGVLLGGRRGSWNREEREAADLQSALASPAPAEVEEEEARARDASPR